MWPRVLLYQTDGRTPVQAVARMGMAQPMRRDLGRGAGPRGGFDDAVGLTGIERPALAEAEHRRIQGCGAPISPKVATKVTDCEHTMLKGQSTMVFPLASLVGVVLVIIWVIRADAGHRGRAATDLTQG